MTQSTNLLEGSVTKHLIRLTVPMIWGIGVIISFQLVDTYFISLLGKQALSAITFTFPITYGVFSISIALGVAMASNIARLAGEKDQESIARVTTQGLLFTFLAISFVCALGFLTYEEIFIAIGAGSDYLPFIHDYMQIWFLSVPLVAIAMVGNSSIRAQGDTVTPAIIMTLAAFANLIVDPILIFGLLGAPALGVAGAAWATVIANGVALVAGLYVLGVRKKYIMTKWITNLSDFGDTCKRLAVISLPVGISMLIQPITNAVIISLLSVASVESVVAFGIASRIEAFAFIVLMALSTSMAPLIGQSWGAKNINRVHEVLKKAIKFSVLWSLMVALVLVLFGGYIVQIFTDDPLIIDMAKMFFWIVPISYALSNILNGWMSAFNAMGQPKRSFTMMIVKYIVMLLPAIWVGHLWGVAGIFIAIAGVNIVSGLIFHILNWKACRECA